MTFVVTLCTFTLKFVTFVEVLDLDKKNVTKAKVTAHGTLLFRILLFSKTKNYINNEQGDGNCQAESLFNTNRTRIKES